MAEPEKEPTFEQMMLQAIEAGHQRNIRYLEAMNQSNADFAWLWLFVSVCVIPLAIAVMLSLQP